MTLKVRELMEKLLYCDMDAEVVIKTAEQVVSVTEVDRPYGYRNSVKLELESTVLCTKHVPETAEVKRAVELLSLAASYIEEHSDQAETVFYDGSDCDGVCLVEDCRAAAESLNEFSAT